ncbi:MAG: hypothetical protein WDZ59_13550 [Pirellulales bacterium]
MLLGFIQLKPPCLGHRLPVSDDGTALRTLRRLATATCGEGAATSPSSRYSPARRGRACCPPRAELIEADLAQLAADLDHAAWQLSERLELARHC